MLYFTSDYTTGAHPDVMARLVATNLEHTVGYGADPYCAEARQLIREACQAPDALVQFLVGGTQTNATVIDALLRRHEGVMAADTAHINVHESGAIEHSGHKVLVLPSHEGKVRADEVEQYVSNFYRDETFEHMVAPGLLYIFTLADIARLCDVFYIGGTKEGALFGEAVVAADPARLPHFFPLVKQHGALLAKGRLLGVQFGALFTDGLYARISRHAVLLAQELRNVFVEHGYRLALDSPTNQQFFILPNAVMDRLLPDVSFDLWGPRGETETTVRFVTSWANTREDIEALRSLLDKI